ncbi:MAG: 16S rRNA (guanine(527)-N(7))-methyltransferase RsmG [Pseudomonadota bacterium]
MTDLALRDRLLRGIDTLQLTVTEDQVATLLRLADRLVHWSARVNLTAIREPAAVIDRHLLDSLAILPWLNGDRILDIGTGAGFPGLPLAIVCPDRHFALLDSVGKKIRFVVQMAAELALPNVAGLNERLPAFRTEPPFMTITARAYARLDAIIDDCEHILADGGRILAMKGQSPDDELAAISEHWQAELVPLDIPGLDEKRHLAILERRR